MAKTLSAKIRFGITGTYKNQLGSEAGDVSYPIDFEQVISIANGTSNGQADIFWGDKGRSISSGGNDDLDLFDGGTIDIGPGAGRDPLGFDLAVAKIVAVYVFNDATSAGNLILGAAASGEFTSIVGQSGDTIGPIKPGCGMLITNTAAAAFTVTDTSNHVLRVNANGGDCTYSIAVLARTA